MAKFLDKTGLDTFWAKIKSTFQTLGNLVTSWGSTPSDTKYPSEKLVKTSLDAKAPNAPSEVTIANGDKIIISDSSDSNKVKRAGVAFDGSTTKNFLSKKGTFEEVKESEVAWGGDFHSDLSPIEMGMYPQNLIANPPPENIKYEQTTDGGETWSVVSLTDSQKKQFCNLTSGVTLPAGPTTTDDNVLPLQRGRVTIALLPFGATEYSDTWCYGQVKRILLYVSRTSSPEVAHCVVEVQTGPHFIANDGVWTTLGDYNVTGDGGWNSIPLGGILGGFSAQLSGRRVAIRFTYWVTKKPTSGSGGRISLYSLGILPGTVWKSNANHVAKQKLPVQVENDGTGIVQKSRSLVTARYLAVSLSNTSTNTSFNGSADVTNIKTTGTLGIGNGGTGATTANAAANNLLSALPDWTANPTDGVKLIRSDTAGGASFGQVTFLTVWNYIKGKISSVLGLSENGYTGNAATATAAQSGSALETAINGKMNTSASNATAPSSSGGDGATATLLNNLTDGNGDIATTDDGDNVLIATTDNGGTVTNKWYKRKLVKLIPWIIKKLGTRLVYDCGTGSTSTTDFDNALAAFNAGKWVIINKDSKVYYCVGSYSGPGLRFKQLADEVSLLKVNTLTWTKGSEPTEGTQFEAASASHTHSQYLTSSDITGKMNTDASNAVAPSEGGTGATATLLNNLSSTGLDDISSDNVCIPTTNSDGSNTNKWYKRPLSKLWPWIKGKMTSDSGVNISGNAATATTISGSQVLLPAHSSDGYIGVRESGKAIAYLEACDGKGGVWVNNGNGKSGWITYRDSDGTVHFGADSSSGYSGVAGDGSVKNFFNGAELCGNSYRNSGTSHYRFYFGKMTPGTDNGAKNFCGLLEVNNISTTSGAVRGTGFVAIIKIDSRNYNEFHVNMSIINNNGWNLTGLRPTLIVEEDGDLRKFSIGFTNASGTLQAFQYMRFNVTGIGYSNGFTYDRWFSTISTKGSGESFWPAKLGDAENAVSANELRIPYGSGSVYLQIGVSGSGNYLELGTNMADGVMVSYAGEASTAAVAGRLGTTSVGSANNPIYLNNGVPTECNWWVS